MPREEAIKTSLLSAVGAFLGVLCSIMALSLGLGDRLWVTRQEFSTQMQKVSSDLSSIQTELRIRTAVINARRELP